MYARNLIVTSIMLLLAACSIVSENKGTPVHEEQKILELKNEIVARNMKIEPIDASAASLREQLSIADRANEKLYQQHELAKHDYFQAVKSSEMLQSELVNREYRYSAALENMEAKIDYKKQQYDSVVAEKKYEKEKALNIEIELKNKIVEVESLRNSLSGKNRLLAHTLLGAIDDFKQNLPEGEMLYNIPETMTKGDVKVVVLELGIGEAVKGLKQELSKREGVPIENIEAEAVKISDRMFATLDATKGLGVRSLDDTKIVQISNTSPNIWRWEIEAKEEGVQKLYLRVGIVLSIDGKDSESVLLNEPREIVVNVSGARSFSSFIKKNWQFLIQILLIPLIIYFWEQFKKYRAKKKEKEVIKPKIIVDG